MLVSSESRPVATVVKCCLPILCCVYVVPGMAAVHDLLRFCALVVLYHRFTLSPHHLHLLCHHQKHLRSLVHTFICQHNTFHFIQAYFHLVVSHLVSSLGSNISRIHKTGQKSIHKHLARVIKSRQESIYEHHQLCPRNICFCIQMRFGS